MSHISIGHGDRILARDISFEIAPGEVILLAGANGTGKTTLLKALVSGGIGPRNLRSQSDLRPSHGKPWAPPSNVPRVAQFLGPIPPETNVILIPTNIPKVKGFTVEGFIRTGCYAESDWRGRISKELEGRLEGALRMLGIEELKGRDISTLSDGEFQKACLAVGLTRQAEVLLLDEPTAFLDVENRIGVLQALRDIARKTGTAVIFSSHDIHDAVQVADRVFVITRDGRFLASDTKNRLDVLQEAFPILEGKDCHPVQKQTSCSSSSC
ncbi:MAG: ABC transporter ATP-binding protein [Bacteroidales bacterium]|nr:ABC transporter ATP-binding protein [Bacteroidales bacterium]